MNQLKISMECKYEFTRGITGEIHTGVPMPKTILVLTPHPDDAEFYAGGTIARFAQEGERVIIVIASDGRRGSFAYSSEKLAPLRSTEAQQAAKFLGVEPPILLSHPDYELDKLPPGKLREEFIRIIRQHRPDIVIAQDPFVPHETHPDHRAVAWAASDAIQSAHLPLLHSEQLSMGLQPHFVVEKYFYGHFPPNIHFQSEASKRGLETQGFTYIVVDISQTIETKMAALSEHKSQMEFMVEEILRQAAMLGPAGPDLQKVMSQAAGDPATAFSWFIKAQAAHTGQKIGVGYGEAFRYERYHPVVESFLSHKT
jgi:LmbE family N-acetylglucosaminyl deacetylase